jgi:succinyl-CoA synthetase beta subunit
MPALPEYRTRRLLSAEDVPLVKGVFYPAASGEPDPAPPPPAYVKAQIPGATSRASQGLVRHITDDEAMRLAMRELLAPGPWGRAEGVLVTEPAELYGEYYAACTLDFGSEGRLPSGVLLFSPEGGSGIEDRSGTLMRLPFSLLSPPSEDSILESLPKVAEPGAVAGLLAGMVDAFVRYRLLVLEANPIGVLQDGTPLVIDCRAEYEERAVRKADRELFAAPSGGDGGLLPLERAVEEINSADPSGTGFFRQNRIEPPEGAWRVATNLCGGGGKMLWEMATGGRDDVYTMNESDTSGGLSAFKSYRILRTILAQEGGQVLFLTGSGMAFQNQHHLAAAVWKALRESPTPLPALLRFGGTDEDRAHELFERVGEQLPVAVRHYRAEVFPNAMMEEIPEVALGGPVSAEPPEQPDGEPAFETEVPPGRFHFFPDRCQGRPDHVIDSCPTGYLKWDGEHRAIVPNPEARCIGCLMCETASLLDGNGELRILLDLPEEVE